MDIKWNFVPNKCSLMCSEGQTSSIVAKPSPKLGGGGGGGKATCD